MRVFRFKYVSRRTVRSCGESIHSDWLSLRVPVKRKRLGTSLLFRYLLQDSHSDWFASAYFIALIIVGSFFLLNVALAVVWDAFMSTDEENRLAEKKRRKHEAKRASRRVRRCWSL